jgi:hypothetical protein
VHEEVYCGEVALQRETSAGEVGPTSAYRLSVDKGEASGRSLDGTILHDPLRWKSFSLGLSGEVLIVTFNGEGAVPP